MSNFYLERIQRGVDFAEAHLDDDVPLVEVARAAGLSQWHFQRIFKSLTGETLKAYIRSRRMARSLERLLTSDLRILDVALLAGFDTQESFARAFKKAFGMTPIEYRNLRNRNLFPRKLKLDEEMLRHIHQHVSLEPEIYRQPAMTLVGRRTLFYGSDSEKNNIGEKLPPLWAAFLERRSDIENARQAICYGVVRQERDDGDQLEYFAAVEVSAIGRVPPGMEVVHIPGSSYAKFEHRGFVHAIDRTVSYAYSTWLVGSGRRHTYGADLEIYDSRYHPTDESSVFCYAIPIAD